MERKNKDMINIFNGLIKSEHHLNIILKTSNYQKVTLWFLQLYWYVDLSKNVQHPPI